MSGNGRIALLDVLRGMSICLVLVAHFGNELLQGLYEFQNRIWNIGVTGVFVFFCVSGYVIPFTIQRIRPEDGPLSRFSQFWTRRAFRLLPVYLTLLLPVWLVVLSSAPDRKHDIINYLVAQPFHYLLALFTFTGYFFNFPLPLGGLEWSLAYEVLFYVGCSLYMLVGPARFKIPLFLGVLTLCSFVFVPGLDHQWHHHGFMLLFFLVGLIVYLGQVNALSRFQMSALLLGVIGTIYARSLSWSLSWGLSYITIAALVAPLLFSAIMIFPKLSVSNRYLAFLGLISYSLYLSHMIVMNALPLAAVNPILKFLIWFVVSVICSFALFKIVENPANLLGRSLASRMSRHSART